MAVKVSFPHMGTAHIPLKAALQQVGAEVMVPPPSSRRTLSLGVRHSPEFVCLPYKLILGNFIEALETGADVLLMIEGGGSCRLRSYPAALQAVLRDLGYQFVMYTDRIFRQGIVSGFLQFVKNIGGDPSTSAILAAVRFGLSKLRALDEIEVVVQKVRARELERESANRIWQWTVQAIDEAPDWEAVAQAKEEALGELSQVPVDGGHSPVRVGIIGEFYVVLDPFVNMELEKELGRLRVEVHRTIMLGHFTLFSLLCSALGLTNHPRRVKQAAMPYLRRDVGGDGWTSVGETALHGNHDSHNYDGLIHVAPFTCMPEIVAQNILPRVVQDNPIPVLTLIFDEQMGRAGMLTRLEAFADLLHRRKVENDGR
jgi:predicted nucleotide-binding protein (sugar kinase/HSP70/actin superfamily)